jgi:uncharacterized membrane-anchored protein
MYECCCLQDYPTYKYSADEQQKPTVIQTNILLSVLQVLLALVVFACVVLAKPHNVEVKLPVGRPRIPGRGRLDRPSNTTVVNVTDQG